MVRRRFTRDDPLEKVGVKAPCEIKERSRRWLVGRVREWERRYALRGVDTQQAQNEVSDVTIGSAQEGAETMRRRRAAENRWSRREASRFGERGRRVLVRLWRGCPEAFARRGRRVAVGVMVLVRGKVVVATSKNKAVAG